MSDPPTGSANLADCSWRPAAASANMLDDAVIEHFRKAAEAIGTGYQTMINSALKAAVVNAKGKTSKDKPLTVSTLRKILREELQAS